MNALRCLLAVVLLAGCATPAVEGAFSNAEFGVAGRFPAGAVVCPAMSGDHPSGFVGRYGNGAGCNDPSGATGVIRLLTHYNTTFEPTAGELLPGDCVEGAIAGSVVSTATLKIGHESASCWRSGADGAVQVYVTTQHGERWGDEPGRRIAVTAMAVIEPARRDQEIARFERFLAALRLTAPEG